MNQLISSKDKEAHEQQKTVEIHREDNAYKHCFAHCVNNFHVDGFVNEEERCIRNCAEKQHSYFNQLQNSASLMENPLYLKFY